MAYSKAIEGLTQVILHLDVMTQISSGDDELRYRELRDYAEDALELLKEREPRVLTLEEMIAIGQIWTSNTPPYLFMDINPSIRRSCGFWCAWCDLSGMISGLHPRYTNDNYGIEWRCWTARPTDGQREAVKWDDKRRSD